MAALKWISAPGGKRYTSGDFMLVRQNTAAGAKRWKATWTTDQTTYVVTRTDYLSDAKRACALYSRKVVA